MVCEVTEHAIGVFGSNAGAAVNSGLDKTRTTIQININLADGAGRKYSTHWYKAVGAKVGFELANILFDASRNMAAGRSVFNRDGGCIWNYDGGGGRR